MPTRRYQLTQQLDLRFSLFATALATPLSQHGYSYNTVDISEYIDFPTNAALPAGFAGGGAILLQPNASVAAPSCAFINNTAAAQAGVRFASMLLVGA